MTNTRFLPTLCLAAAALLSGWPGLVTAETREELTLKRASVVLDEMQGMPDLSVPQWLLARAEGIVILPEVVKFGVGIGGRFGTGVMLVRNGKGQWSNPVLVSLTGGSFGWQFGGQATDIVLVFTTRQGVEGISDGKVTLGADASVAAGPVGRTASAATTPSFDAEIYSFSRTRGLFAGLSLEGAAMTVSRKANEVFYRKPGVTATEILDPAAPAPPPPGPALMQQIDRLTAEARVAAAAAAAAKAQPAAAPAPASPSPAPPAAAPASSDAAQTFPLEDAKPGSEPPPNS